MFLDTRVLTYLTFTIKVSYIIERDIGLMKSQLSAPTTTHTKVAHTKKEGGIINILMYIVVHIVLK